MYTPPKDLLEYLTTLISPPPSYGEPAGFYPTPDVDLSNVPDNSLTGAIVCGTPTDEQAALFLQKLRPGAHLLLAAPDEQPTGHTGACRLEDAGFEIRDSILVVEEPGRLHYVPKAARKEREAGCEHLPGRTSADAKQDLETEEGGETEPIEKGKDIKNFHPTCKPTNIMKRLLSTIPVDKGPILDPFLGSGTTLVACLSTGHDAIGIEREEDYLQIADARIRHWDRKTPAKEDRTIESDTDSRKHEKPLTGGVFDLFGSGGAFGSK